MTKEERLELAYKVAEYTADKFCNVRETAKHFRISKSTVHNYIVKILPQCPIKDEALKVLAINKHDRHNRGGLATKNKYKRG